ncbi:hypothetical protein PCL_04961 [Purpureocillium lilacinum]|uniref:Uncharacterized protein n=1 Tax=Purpureocillium lilacinum TaxID=33203 RepID=A0A2U3DWA9_PURLI|nr:hypothetical protein Purlil1_12663 [Purpureocillium lilacinum]PWI66548.1 hypothetical protein PCL_04961 [Purpureocillium lilacinum]
MDTGGRATLCYRVAGTGYATGGVADVGGLRNEGKCHLQDRPCTEPTAAKPLEADSLLARGGRAPGPGVKNAHIHTRGRCAAMRPKGARRAAGSMHEYPGAQHGAAQHSQPRGPAELKTLKPHLRLRRDRTTRGDACDSPAARRYYYRHHHHHHHQVHARAFARNALLVRARAPYAMRFTTGTVTALACPKAGARASVMEPSSSPQNGNPQQRASGKPRDTTTAVRAPIGIPGAAGGPAEGTPGPGPHTYTACCSTSKSPNGVSLLSEKRKRRLRAARRRRDAGPLPDVCNRRAMTRSS